MEGASPNKWFVPVVFVAGAAVGAVAVLAVQRLDANPHKDAKAVEAKAPAQASATKPSDVALMPGEQLVLSPQPPASQIPKPPDVELKGEPPKTSTAPPSAQPKTYSPPPVATRPIPAPPPVVAQGNARPSPPQFTRDERRGTSYDRSRSVCLNCGVVSSVTRFDDYWDVRVRLDDGSRESVRYYDSPPVRAGDAVHFEDGRLVRD